MGTNYYFHPDNEVEPVLHIGKSSGGWHFALALHPNEDIMNLEEWIEHIINTKGTIRDEYGTCISIENLLNIVMNRKQDYKVDYSPAWLERNHAMLGKNGLVRSIIDGSHCIAHGKGTYDYFIGDFS